MTSHTRPETRGVLRCFSNAGSRTPLCCCVFQLLRYVMVCCPKIQTSALTYHAQASEETAPKKVPFGEDCRDRAEARPLPGVKKTALQPHKTTGQKGSQRPGQPPEPTPSCLCVTDPPGQPTLPKAPAHWRKPLLPEHGRRGADRHHFTPPPRVAGTRGQGPATT